MVCLWEDFVFDVDVFVFFFEFCDCGVLEVFVYCFVGDDGVELDCDVLFIFCGVVFVG